MKPPSYYKHAFNEKANWFGMAAAVGLSAVLFTPVPLIVGAAAEAIYLIFVPDSKWYRRRVDQIYEKEVAAKREAMKAQMLKELSDRDRSRFRRLEGLRTQIFGAMNRESESVRSIMGAELRKLDYLLESYLSFLSAHARYERHLAQISPQQVEIEIQSIKSRLATETDESVKKVLSQNLELMNKRCEILQSVAKNARVVLAQLDAIENTFELINDRVVSMKSPEQISSELQAVVENVDMTAGVIEETAPLLEEAQRAARMIN